MKGYYRHILAATAVLLTTAACNKNEPDGPQQVNAPIAISATEAGVTKALLDNGSFKTPGNRIQVYDFVDDGSTTVKHIDAYAGPDVESNSPMHEYGTTWPFEDKATGQPTIYQWIPGTHKFFGWLAKDANFGLTTPMTPETFFGNGFEFNEGEQTLTIPAKTIDYTTPQFDFMYSNVVTTEPQNDPVNLSFNHLFTAVSIGAKNISNQPVNIKSFTISVLKNRNSALISWDADGNATGQISATATYGTATEGSSPYRTLLSSYTLLSDEVTGNIFRHSEALDRDYTIIWPQSSEDVHSKDSMSDNPETGEPMYPDTYKMEVVYTVTDSDGLESDNITKRLNFPELAWEAGKKYHFEVVFSDKMISLDAVVLPWIYEYSEMDFSDAGIQIKEGNELKWDKSTFQDDPVNHYAIIKDGQPVKGTFTIDAPQGGTWIASLVGDIDAFEVVPSSGTINGQSATIVVKQLVGDPRQDYSVKLKFAIRRPDGRIISADSELQGDDEKQYYTIVLPKN